MIYYVIGEPEFEASSWYKSILEGLQIEKRQKRITLCTINSSEDIDSIVATGEDAVFVIGSESEWLDNITARLETKFSNRVIVLGNHTRSRTQASYSVVTADIVGDVRLLDGYLRSLGKNRVALYGINPLSTSDADKKAAFLALGYKDDDLFFNNGSLCDCWADFKKRIDEYDGVICVNGYAAISLVKRLGDRRLFVTAIGSSRLASYTPVGITHTCNDYRAYAGAGIDLARLLVKNSSINSITVRLCGGFSISDSTDNASASNLIVAPASNGSRGDTKFYADTEICEMTAIENMLSSSDRDDIEIISSILKGETYQTIAERRYMSTNGVKYKLKNMYELCGVSGRAEFVELLLKYIDPDKL